MKITLKIEDMFIEQEITVDELYCLQSKKEIIKWKIEDMISQLLGNKEFENKYIQIYS